MVVLIIFPVILQTVINLIMMSSLIRYQQAESSAPRYQMQNYENRSNRKDHRIIWHRLDVLKNTARLKCSL